MSHLLNSAIDGYQVLPDFATENGDASLRDVVVRLPVVVRGAWPQILTAPVQGSRTGAPQDTNWKPQADEPLITKSSKKKAGKAGKAAKAPKSKDALESFLDDGDEDDENDEDEDDDEDDEDEDDDEEDEDDDDEEEEDEEDDDEDDDEDGARNSVLHRRTRCASATAV